MLLPHVTFCYQVMQAGQQALYCKVAGTWAKYLDQGWWANPEHKQVYAFEPEECEQLPGGARSQAQLSGLHTLMKPNQESEWVEAVCRRGGQECPLSCVKSGMRVSDAPASTGSATALVLCDMPHDTPIYATLAMTYGCGFSVDSSPRRSAAHTTSSPQRCEFRC